MNTPAQMRKYALCVFVPLLQYLWEGARLLSAVSPRAVEVIGAVSCAVFLLFATYLAYRNVLESKFAETIFVIGIANPAIFARFAWSIEKTRPEIEPALITNLDVAIPNAPFLAGLIVIVVAVYLTRRANTSSTDRGT